MIVDEVAFSELKPYSNKTVLCRCDCCGTQRHVKKYDLTKWGGYTICRSCRGREIGYSGKLRRKTIRKTYTKDEQFFSTPTLLNSYWAGFIAADGCLHKGKRKRHILRFGLSAKDRSILERFVEDTKYTGLLTERIYDGHDRVRLAVNSAKQWFEHLEKNFSITGDNKSESLLPPKLSTDLALRYIVGIIDGDGCVYINPSDATVLKIVGTHHLLSWIKGIFDALVPSSRIANIHKTQSEFCYQYLVSGERADMLLTILKEIPVRKLERKWATV